MASLKTGRGITLSIIAMLCLAGMDATGKFLVETYSITQIMAIRFAVFLLIVLLVIASTGKLGEIRSRSAGSQVFRSLVLVIEVSVFIFAFSLMPLADVHAIAATAPLFAILMAGWYLDETIDRRSWISVSIGFIGAMIIIRPGLGIMSWHAAVPICGAILWAAYQVLSRRVAEFDSPETTVFFTAFIGCLVFGALAPLFWITPSPGDWLLLTLNGILGATGHYLLIRALACAPASVLQPFGYALLFWAIVIGFFVFGDLPDGFTLLGAAVVLAAGIYASDAGRAVGQRSSTGQGSGI